MNKLNKILILALALSLFSVACNEKPKAEDKDRETMTSGKLTAYCDDAIINLMDSTFTLYRMAYPNVELTVETGTAREVMSKLLSGQARVVIIARDYLKDEDSLMTAYKVKKHNFEDIANDALTIFSGRDFPLDTLNADQIFNILTDKNKTLKSYYPQLKEEPTIAICEQNSSIYANMKKLMAKDKPIMRNLKLFSTVDSVKMYVKNTPNSLGIAYLNNVVRNLDFLTIPIGFHDSTGKYITPKPVHQAYVIQGLYPYIVTFRAMFFEEFKNLPFWFGVHVAREAVVTRYLKEAGVVPTYAKFKLIKED